MTYSRRGGTVSIWNEATEVQNLAKIAELDDANARAEQSLIIKLRAIINYVDIRLQNTIPNRADRARVLRESLDLSPEVFDQLFNGKCQLPLAKLLTIKDTFIKEFAIEGFYFRTDNLHYLKPFSFQAAEKLPELEYRCKELENRLYQFASISDSGSSSQEIAKMSSSSIEYALSHMSYPTTASDVSSLRGESGKGGWLKGLPRNPKTSDDQTLIDIWKNARKQGYVPNTIDDLLMWGTNNATDQEEKDKVYKLYQRRKNAQQRMMEGRRITSLNGRSCARRPYTAKRGGWLKGVPRHPKSDEELTVLDIWHSTRQEASPKQFANLNEMLSYWIDSQLDADSKSFHSNEEMVDYIMKNKSSK